jgi:polysaccharide export outer membrane protein
MQWLKMILSLTGIGLLVACGGSGAVRVKPMAFREVCKQTEDTAAKETENLQDRLIAMGMQLGVTVEEDPSLTRSYVVPTDCAVDFGGVGRIKVCGLTTEELTKKIKAVLERDFFQKATVTVTIESVYTPTAADGVVYVLGEVNRPGPMRLPAGEYFTVTKMIIAAGGFSSFARGNAVRVVRYCNDGLKYETVINVKRIMKNGEFEKDVPLQPTDWIIVPQRLFSFF